MKEHEGLIGDKKENSDRTKGKIKNEKQQRKKKQSGLEPKQDSNGHVFRPSCEKMEGERERRRRRRKRKKEMKKKEEKQVRIPAKIPSSHVHTCTHTGTHPLSQGRNGLLFCGERVNQFAQRLQLLDLDQLELLHKEDKVLGGGR